MLGAGMVHGDLETGGEKDDQAVFRERNVLSVLALTVVVDAWAVV